MADLRERHLCPPDCSVQIAFSPGWTVRVAVKGKVFCPPVLSAISSTCCEISSWLGVDVHQLSSHICILVHLRLYFPLKQKESKFIQMQKVYSQVCVSLQDL